MRKRNWAQIGGASAAQWSDNQALKEQMKSRIKISAPIIATRAQAEALAGEITVLMIEQRTEINARDAAITSINDDYSETLQTLKKDIDVKTKLLQEWANANKVREFCGKESLEMTHGKCGFRAGKIYVDKPSKLTWQNVLARINSFIRYRKFIHQVPEINKEKLISERATLTDTDLKSMGIKFSRDDSFYYEPKLTDQDTTVKQEAA